MYLHPKQWGGGNHCKERAKEGSEDTRKGAVPSEARRDSRSTKEGCRRGGCWGQGDKRKARDHLVLKNKEVNPQSGGILAAASAPVLQGSRTGGKWKS